MRTNTHWTTRKIARLRQCYLKMSWDELTKEFAPHPRKSIGAMANKMGLRKRNTQRDWKVICARHKPVILRWRGTT